VTVEYAAFEGQGITLLSGSSNLTVSLVPGVSAPLTFGAKNAASGVGTYISPGGLVSIYGLQLADQAEQPGNVPFPKQVNGTQVLMGGKPLPLRYVASNQVNAQVPFDLNVNSAQQLVVQRDTTLSVPQNVVVAAAQPAVYTQDQSGSGPGVIVNGQTNVLITSANPAHAEPAHEHGCFGCVFREYRPILRVRAVRPSTRRWRKLEANSFGSAGMAKFEVGLMRRPRFYVN